MKECVLVEILYRKRGNPWFFAEDMVRMNVPYGEMAQFNISEDEFMQFKIHKLRKRWWRR